MHSSIIKTGIYLSILMISFYTCKKEAQENSTNNNEFISFKVNAEDFSFIYKPYFTSANKLNSTFDTINNNMHVEFVSQNNTGDRMTIILNNVNLNQLNYPFLILDTINSHPFGNNNKTDIYFWKHKNDSILNYDLTSGYNAQIILDSFDSPNNLLRGEFSGRMYGHIFGEAIFPISDSVNINNGHFVVRLKKQ